MSEKHKVIPAVYLVLKKDNKVLLLRRFNTGYEDGNYSMIAGHVDGEETFREAMVREAYEEGGIKINPSDLNIIHILHRIKPNKEERLDVFFNCDDFEGEPKIMEPEKCDDLSWFPTNKLPKNTIDFIKQVIERIEDLDIYSEFGFDSIKK